MAIFSAFAVFPALAAAQSQAPTKVLIKNVSIFNGKDENLASGMSVLVEGNKIAKIAKSISAPAGATVIDAKGRVLMPGLTDAHWHAMMANLPLAVTLSSDVGYINLAAAVGARETLMRGFTTVRDVAGPSFSLKRAIDEGLVDGPRIYPSGAMLS